MHLECKVTMKDNGRLVLPIKIRKQLGVSSGDQLLFVLNKELTIIPLKIAVRQFQEKIRQRNKQKISLVDALKETRTAEFQHE